MTGIELIAAERAEQMSKHGWTPEHDDQHRYGELAIQAASLACMGTDFGVRENNSPTNEHDDSWGLRAKLADDRIHALKVAGALIAAELDREVRLQSK